MLSAKPAFPLPGFLGPEQIAMIDKGVSAIVASSDALLRPSLMRAVGSAITPDGREVTVWLVRGSARQLLLDIAATGRIAVVFSEPATHRTVQLKAASGVRMRDASEADRPVLARYLASMEHEVGRVGYGPHYVRAMLSHRLEDTVAVSFVPEQAFDQTPGPRAGSALPAAAP
jgi:hypothetical protein